MKDIGENGVWWKKESTAQGLQRDIRLTKNCLMKKET